MGRFRSFLSVSISLFAISFIFCSLTAASPTFAAPKQYSASVTVKTTGTESSNLSFNLETTPDDNIAIQSQSVNVKTNAKTGYKLYLSTNSLDAELTNTVDNQHKIAAAGHSHSNPAPLISNTWGYTIPKNTPNSVNAANFDSTYNIPSLLESAGGNSKWAGITPRTSPTLIHQVNSPTSDSGETFTVYYAIKANSALPAGKYTNAILYTVVFEQYKPEWGDLSYIQDMTPEICAKAAPGSVSSLIDRRDNKVYDVIKASDSNCWMKENLALDLSPTVTLTPEDTDVKQPWTPSHQTQAPEETGGSWPDHINSARSYRQVNPIDGNLYNFYAATANNLPDIRKAYAGNSFNHSICPRGWTLPGDHALDMEELFWKMINYNVPSPDLDITSYIPDVGLTKSGQYSGDVQQYRQRGFYWTSFKDEAHQALGFSLKENNTIARIKTTTTIGMSVRCIARGAVDQRSLNDITYMQEMNYDICSHTPEHTIKALIDRRDGKTYRVAKAKDGNCWMVDNLALSLNTDTTLTPENTDIQSPWTPNLNTQSPSQTGNSYKWYLSYAESHVAEYGNARSYNTGIANYGIMYNYHAATAGSGTLALNATNFNNAPHSICPKNWQLPISSNLGGDAVRCHRSYRHLTEKYGNQAENLEVSPLFFVRSGQYVATSGNYNAAAGPNQNYFSGFWSARKLFGGNHIVLGNHPSFNRKYGDWGYYHIDGFAVRCVAR